MEIKLLFFVPHTTDLLVIYNAVSADEVIYTELQIYVVKRQDDCGVTECGTMTSFSGQTEEVS